MLRLPSRTKAGLVPGQAQESVPLGWQPDSSCCYPLATSTKDQPAAATGLVLNTGTANTTAAAGLPNPWARGTKALQNSPCPQPTGGLELLSALRNSQSPSRAEPPSQSHPSPIPTR